MRARCWYVAVLSSRRPMVSDARNAYECEKWGFLMESSERRRGRGGRRTARRTDDRAARSGCLEGGCTSRSGQGERCEKSAVEGPGGTWPKIWTNATTHGVLHPTINFAKSWPWPGGSLCTLAAASQFWTQSTVSLISYHIKLL